MANFELFAPTLHRWEGGFVNDPDDLGGATNMGITLNTFRVHYSSGMTVDDLRNMTEAQWRHIMKTSYWDRCGADKIANQSNAEQIVDWCVNAGLMRIKTVQGILQVKQDGQVGPKTLAALNAYDQRELHTLIKASRVEYYKQIAEKRPANRKFLKGWLRRAESYVYHD